MIIIEQYFNTIDLRPIKETIIQSRINGLIIYGTQLFLLITWLTSIHHNQLWLSLFFLPNFSFSWYSISCVWSYYTNFSSIIFPCTTHIMLAHHFDIKLWNILTVFKSRLLVNFKIEPSFYKHSRVFCFLTWIIVELSHQKSREVGKARKSVL